MVITTTLTPSTVTVERSVALVDFPDGTAVQVVNPLSVADAVARAEDLRAGRFGDCRCRC